MRESVLKLHCYSTGSSGLSLLAFSILYVPNMHTPLSGFSMCSHLPLPTRCCAVQADLVKDGGHHYFISSLDVAEPGMSADSRAQAAFVLAVICDGHRRGRLVCAEQGLLQKLLSLLSSMVSASVFRLRLPLPAL